MPELHGFKLAVLISQSPHYLLKKDLNLRFASFMNIGKLQTVKPNFTH